MKRRDLLAGLALLPLASCGGMTPAFAEPEVFEFYGFRNPSRNGKFRWVTIDGKSYTEQLRQADLYAFRMHERLIADGWKWDGMDGYSK